MRPALLGLLATACSIGPRVQKFTPAITPGGARAVVVQRDSEFSAELLAVTDSGFLLVWDTRVVLARTDVVDRVSFPDLPDDLIVRRGQPLSREAREQLRLFSRYPNGLSPPLLAQLLAAYHQDSLDVLRP
jgi:hypothetical protein